MTKNKVFDYISKEEYNSKIKGLKNDETRIIYKKDNIEIYVKKINKKIYKFINHYGSEKLEDCLVNMYNNRPA